MQRESQGPSVLVMSEKIRVTMPRPDSDTAYIALPGYPEKVTPGVVKKSICLDDICD